ncbi:MAG: thiamine pyrophosphate-dependent enzyme [Halobacteria archaeon]
MQAVAIPKPEERTIKRPVANCPGCGATKVSMALKEGLRRYNKENKTSYKLIYVADRGCGNLQGWHEYGIVDAIYNMGMAPMVALGARYSSGGPENGYIVVCASGDGAYNFNINGMKIAAQDPPSMYIIYDNYSIRMTGGQLGLRNDYEVEGRAIGFEVYFINPYRYSENAEIFKKLIGEYLNKKAIMVVADGTCSRDLRGMISGKGIKLGTFVRKEGCKDLVYQKEREKIAKENPEKLKEMPPFKCRLCGMHLRCQALLENDPTRCFNCGACAHYECEFLTCSEPNLAMVTEHPKKYSEFFEKYTGRD